MPRTLPALFLAVALLHSAAGAQARVAAAAPASPGRLLTQYAQRHWDDRDGLPQNSVQALAQTRDGYLWLGTQAGLVRFDGVRFTTFDRTASPALERPYIWSLAADDDGSLWIGTEETGLIHYQDGRFTRFGKAQGLPSSWVSTILRDRAGNLWVGTTGGGLARMRQGRIERIDSAKVPGSNIFALHLDAQGAVWVGSNRGLTRIQNGQYRTFGAAEGLPRPYVFAILPARGGGFWLGGAGRLMRFQNERVTASYDSASGVRGAVRQLAEDPDGSLWLGGMGGLSRLAGGHAQAVPESMLPRGGVEALLRDREGNLWIGTSGVGLHRLSDSPILPFGVLEGMGSDAVYPVMQDHAGAIWSSSEAGVSRLDPSGQLTTLPGTFAFSLAEDRAGAIWIGTGVGLSRVQDGRTTQFTQADGLPDPAQVRAVLPDRAGRLWLATTQGVMRFRPGTPRLYTARDGLAPGGVTTLFEDRDGAIWAGTRRGLSRLDGGRITTWTVRQGLPDADVTSLLRTADGDLWISTEGGLARMRNGRIRSVLPAAGLCDAQVHWLLADGHGRLWMSANRGIFSNTLAELNAAADQAGGGTVSCTLFGRTEGMRSRETNGAVNPAGVKLRDGRLVFPSMGGLAFFDPERLASRRPPPPVQVEEVLADGAPVAANARSLPAGVHEVEVRFTALSFQTPEKIEFRYRLQGLDDQWVDAGTRRTAWFTRLPAGTYHFEVAARHPGGAWSPAAAAYGFRVLPRFYETIWFRAAAALAALLLVYLLYRKRIRTLQARERGLLAVVEERTRAEARYRELFDNATDAVFITDLEGRLTALNRRAEELTGYGQGSAVGMSVRELLPPGADSGELLDEWLAGSGEARTLELVARDGSRVPLELTTRRVEQGGRAVGTQAVGRDVRERAALEQQLRESQKMEAVGRLAGGVAHDFNNLLTIIKGSSELMLMDLPEGDERREDVEMVLSASERATGLTRQLLAFSRRQVTQPREVDLNALVTGLEPMLRRLIGEDIRVTSSTCGEPARVLADPGQLEQVLVNLAVNARDAMASGGTLTLRTSIVPECGPGHAELGTAQSACVLLSLTDTGSGMDAATQARIFEPFFTTKAPGKGTGLGLATVYGIVRQSGGTVQCFSRPGRGTTFQILLPYAGVPGERAAPAPLVAAPGLGVETILLVEDEIAVRSMASRILRRSGYTVLETAGGEEALRVARSDPGPIQLLLTDVVMPQMSGRELAERVAPLRREMRVLYMSGYTDDEIIRRGLFEPGVRYLQKPFSLEGLAQAVRELLDQDEAASAWEGAEPAVEVG
jgi:PAS domain S-box-containing protein